MSQPARTQSKPVTENTIYVRNLNFDSTAGDIGKAFEKFGSVKNVRIAKEKFRGSFRSLGYCFVEFKEHEGQVKALEGVKEAPIKLDDWTLKVFAARPPRPKKGDTIFISGIPKGTTADMLKAVFDKYGIKDIRMKKEDEEGKRGFAFVQFETIEGQEKAVAENGTISLNGGESRVRFARPIRRRRFPIKRNNSKAAPAEGEPKKKTKKRAPRRNAQSAPAAPASE